MSTHVGFSFSPSEAGIAEFFSEELPALIRSAAGLCLMGYECTGVDFASRRVYFRPIDLRDGPSANPGAVAPASPPASSSRPAGQEKTADQTCQHCANFAAGEAGSQTGQCRHHGFAVIPTETCTEWKPRA